MWALSHGFAIVGTVLVPLGRLAISSVILACVVAGICTPLLLFSRVRALFIIGVTNRWLLNYVLVIVAIAVVQVFLIGAILVGGDALFSPPGMDSPAEDAFLFRGLIVLIGVSLVLLWLIPVVILPRIGYDWDPHEYDLTTMVVIGGSVLWYQIVGFFGGVLLATIYIPNNF